MIRKIFFILTLSLVFFWAGCNVHEPVLPSWEVLVRIPFTVDKFAVGDSILKDPSITVQEGDADSVLRISIGGQLNAHELSSRDLSIKPENSDDSITLDTLTLNPQPLQSPFITLRTLMPGLSNLIGQTVTIPDTTVFPPSISISAGDFEQIHMLSGTVRLTVTNDLPFSIGPNGTSNGLQVNIVNTVDNTIFTSVLFSNPILPGTQAQHSTPVTNKWLISPIRFDYEFPVHQPATVLITDSLLDNAGISLRLELINVKSDEAIADFDEQEYSEVLKIGYEDERRLINAVIDRGMLTFHFNNTIPLSAQIDLTLPAFDTNPDPGIRDSLRTTINLPANGSTTQEILLNGLEISNPENPGMPIDTFEIIVDGRTENPSGIIHLTGADFVAVQSQSDTLFFQNLKGILSNDSIDIEPIVEENLANYQGFEGGVQLSDADLSLTLYSELFIENLLADITFTGYHENESGVFTDSASLELTNLPFTGGTPGNPGVTHIIFPGENVTQFLNILPTSFKFSGRVRASGETDVAVGDKIWADYLFETPLKAKLTGLSTYRAKVDTLTDKDISTEIQDVPDENFIESTLNVSIFNHTPLGGSATIIFSSDFSDPDIYDAVFDTSLTIMREVHIAAADVDPATGFVLTGKNSEVNLALNQRELRLIKNPPIRVGVQIRADDTPGFVTLRQSDYIRVLGGVNLRLLVRGD